MKKDPLLKALEENKKEAIENANIDIMSARQMFNDKHMQIIGALEALENQECITTATSNMLKLGLFSLQTQINKMEIAYHKIRKIAEEPARNNTTK